MQPDVVIIPAKGVADGKSRLANVLSHSRRQALNLAQLQQTMHAALAVFGCGNTYVVSPCERVQSAALAQGVNFIRECTPPGLNPALEQARAKVLHDGPRCIAVLPVDLPCISEAALRDLLDGLACEDAIVVPDRAAQGTNFMRLPAACEIPFAYGEGSFARHVRLIAQAGFTPRMVAQSPLRDDLDEPQQLPLHAPYGELLRA